MTERLEKYLQTPPISLILTPPPLLSTPLSITVGRPYCNRVYRKTALCHTTIDSVYINLVPPAYALNSRKNSISFKESSESIWAVTS